MAGTASLCGCVCPIAGPQHSRYVVAWTSDACCGCATGTIGLPAGYIRIKRFIPGSGCDAPSALYDVTMTDSNCYDILGGSGANLSATCTSTVKPTNCCWICKGCYTANITNAGNSNTGVFEVVIQRF